MKPRTPKLYSGRGEMAGAPTASTAAIDAVGDPPAGLCLLVVTFRGQFRLWWTQFRGPVKLNVNLAASLFNVRLVARFSAVPSTSTEGAYNQNQLHIFLARL